MSTRSSTAAAVIASLFVAGPLLAQAPTPVFMETWENAADATTLWRTVTANDGDSTGDTGAIVTMSETSPCSTTFQRETFAAHRGRVFTNVPVSGTNIPLNGASAYCVTAWIRGSVAPNAKPFIGIVDDTATGAAQQATDFLIGTFSTPTMITPDGTWQWATADYTSAGSGGDTVYVDLVDELWDGQGVAGQGSDPGATADFDDIAIWPGTCAALVTALGGTPPTHQSCGGTTSICETTDQAAFGRCVQCDGNNDCTSTPSTPICRNHSCTAGCLSDADCGGAGMVCDGSNNCVAGCRGGGTPVGCPSMQFCTSETSTIGMCTTACDFTDQCPIGQICAASNVDAGPTNCVQCTADNNCSGVSGKHACTSTFVCAECTSGNTTACMASGTGAICLSDNTCGCNSDSDCGGSTSGRICNSSTHKCATGCRGTGGNGCPPGMQCSSADSSPGTCSGIPPVVDMAMAPVTDMAMAAVMDMAVATVGDMNGPVDDLGPAAPADMAKGNGGSGGSGGSGLTGGGGGCSCDVSGHDDAGGALFLLFALAFALRRRLGVKF